jgi:hypothetical protein
MSRNGTRYVRPCFAFVLAAAFVTPARGQSKQWDSTGVTHADHLGRSITYVPDVDGDGIVDFLVGATCDDPPDHGRAYLVSGGTGGVLHQFDGDAVGDQFGSIVADLGDVDGDGIRDFAIAAPNRSVPGSPPGAIFVYSGTGTLIRTIVSASNQEVGTKLVALDDVDGDGVRDLLYIDGQPGPSCTVFVASGATGATIRTHTSSAGDYGGVVSRAGDVDADGRDDYVIRDLSAGGTFHIHSGQTGAELYTYASDATLVTSANDVDLDGHADLLFSNPAKVRVELVTGATGVLLFARFGYKTFGTTVSPASDMDGDGHPDILVTRLVDPNDPNDPGYDLLYLSGVDGHRIRRYFANGGIHACDATADADGDGFFDVLATDETYWPNGSGIAPNGRAFCVSGATGGSVALGMTGISYASHLGSGMTVVSDRDGDGYRDVALLAWGGLEDPGDSEVRIASGADGHELARFTTSHSVLPGDHQMAAVDDVDGDGIEDLAIVWHDVLFPFVSVEIRSGADDSLISTLPPPHQNVSEIAAATDVDGTPLLAIDDGGDVDVVDLLTGTVRSTSIGVGDRDVACMGDVDGDGFVDWVVYDGSTGCVNVFTGGSSPTILWTFQGITGDLAQGVTSTGDLDGDGIDDVLTSELTGISSFQVTARSGKDGSAQFVLAHPQLGSGFGRSVESLGDVNLDGVCDFAIAAPSAHAPWFQAGSVFVYSGATRSLLCHVDGDVAHQNLGRVLGTNRWHADPRVDPDPIPDLLVAADPAFYDLGRGLVRLYRLDDLFLQIDPAVASVGQVVTLATNGGPNAAAAGLFAVAFDATPVNQFFAFGVLDASGAWTLSGTVPTGLAGHTLTLRSYAVGFQGKVVDSQDQTLTFQ